MIRFFVDNRRLNWAHVNPIVDHTENQQLEPVIVFVEHGVAEERPPEHPNFHDEGPKPRGDTAEVEAVARPVGA